jgi:hypothetical protein
VLGAFIALHWDLWSLTLPLAALIVLIGIDLSGSRRPGAAGGV